MLRGAIRTIDRYRPVLFLEVARPFTRRMGYEPDHLFEFLYERNYASFTVDFVNCSLVPVGGYQGTQNYLFRS